LESKDKLAALLPKARKAVFAINHIIQEFLSEPLGHELHNHRPLPPHFDGPWNKLGPVCLAHTRVLSRARPHCIKDALDAHPAISACLEQTPGLVPLKADLFVLFSDQ
jgi:hypothetical protein